ncbi:DUF882 domain-containing protein [Devosia limi]|uniref:DUF882 domain-containing protein n=1 Tax=Devosia limi TaxID=288995 RepID=UPI001FCE224D|nr:DUF882 domain-containing protein [Devosia limi]
MKRHHIVRLAMAALMSITVLLPQAVVPASAASERSLYLYYTHTKETARIVFKRNGQYVQSGLNELNRFLRDWRRNEPAKMDPRLFDLVWEVYQEVGASKPVTVVSAYRSPATNEMLRASSSGVAENSQHTRGNAMDFYIPGVSLTKLRAAAMRKQVGGVGYYPTSGSPFVHLDTGNVRAWPRMTRAQLKQIFPDGKTLHVPNDGKPLSQEGYRLAQAEWQRCHSVPCNGGSSGTRVASNSGGSGKTLFGMLFGGDENEVEDVGTRAPAPSARVQVAAAAPAQIVPPANAIANAAAPMPMLRPAALGAPAAMAAIDQPPVIPFSTTGSAPLQENELRTAMVPPVPLMKSQTLLVATAAALPAGSPETAVVALAAMSQPYPQPRLHMSAREPEPVMTAYAPVQAALETIIENDTITTASVAPIPRPAFAMPKLAGVTGLRTASLGGGEPAVGVMTNLFDSTFGALEQHKSESMATALAEMVARRPNPADPRQVELIAPDLEHIAEVFVAPAALSSSHFAVIFEHDEADFDPSTEMGRYVTVMGVGDEPAELSHTRFVAAKPLVVALN